MLPFSVKPNQDLEKCQQTCLKKILHDHEQDIRSQHHFWVISDLRITLTVTNRSIHLYYQSLSNHQLLLAIYLHEFRGEETNLLN